jgi:hypothetical protein
MNTTAVSGDERPATVRIDDLLQTIRVTMKPGMEEELQTQLARSVKILRRLYDEPNSADVASAELVVMALLREQPNTKFAVEVLDFIDRETPSTFLRSAVRRLKAPTLVILGMATLLFVAIPLGGLLLLLFNHYYRLSQGGLGVNVPQLASVGLAGALGSMVSIMARLNDFSPVRVENRSVVFFTGFFKPVIGMSFGMFVFAALNGGLLPPIIKRDDPYFGYAVVALAFLSGFSERFAQDIASKVGSALTTHS